MVFEELYEMMKNVSKDSLDMSISDCHIKGCFSLVVGGKFIDCVGGIDPNKLQYTKPYMIYVGDE